MSDKEHVWIAKLKQQLADRLISRREFVRYSALLGMSAGAAYMWAGKIAGEPFAPVKGGARFHFEMPGAVQGFRSLAGDAVEIENVVHDGSGARWLGFR